MKITKPVQYAGAAFAALMVLAGLMWAGVPPLLQSFAQTKGSELIGRKIHVGSVEFNPLSMELTVNDIAVDTADGSAKQLAVQRAYVNVELQSLLRLAPVIKAVQLDSPKVLLTHLGAGKYDIDDIVQKLDTPPDPAGPARFAVYNVGIKDGAVDFVDRDVKTKSERLHTIRDLTLSLPFISNLNAYQSVEVVPRVAFKLNDVPFDSNAQATPFNPTPQGALTLQISGLRLEPYLPYLPASLPVNIAKGSVDADVQLDFKQPPAPATPFVSVRGKMNLSDVQVRTASGQDLLQWGGLQLDMADVRPLERSIKLSNVQITAPVVHVVRNKAGTFNLALSQPSSNTDATATEAKPWSVELAKFGLQQGVIHWHDGTMQTGADISLTDMALDATGVQWPAQSPAKAEGSFTIASQEKSKLVNSGKLTFNAEGTDKDVLLNVQLTGLGAGLANPYLASFLEPKLSGTVDADMQAQWRDQNLNLTLHKLSVKDFVLQNPSVAKADAKTMAKVQMPGFKLFEIKDAKLDLNRQSIQISSVQLQNPAAYVKRDAQGEWEFMQWIKPQPANSEQKKSSSTSQPWKLALNQVQLNGGNIRLEDRTTPRTVRLEVSKLNAKLQNLRWDGQHLAAQDMPVSLSASVQSGRTDPGTIDFQGGVRAHPHLEAKGKFNLHELPLHAVYPYVSRQFNIDVLRADANAQGKFQFAARPEGPQFTLNTNAAIEDVRVKTVPAQQQGGENLGLGEELLRWKALNVPGVEVAMAPHKPTTVRIQEVVWSDFYARLLVDKSGRLNLQGLVKEVPEDQTTAAEIAAPAAAVTNAATPQPATVDPVVYLGPVKLVNGKVDFTDQFIQPNYSADLSDLNGTLSQVSSVRSDGVVQMADLSLRGRAEGTAQLEIVGKLNPLVKPLVLDIRGKVHDLELPPLSTYSVKYAGYGIERGKLSVDVNYNIQPDGQLKAGNKIVLNQLTFGDKVPTSAANLPVKLAVALLQDRNGVIDIDLPISGSIDDPEFRIGPIIFKVLGNIIKKAITSPFSLLASAFSGSAGADLNGNAVQFAAGSSALTESTQQMLNQLAKTLVQKPGVMVTVSGTASEAAEREAMQRAQLNKLLQNHKRRRANVTESNTKVDAVLAADEYAALLKEVYRRADIVKPRNALGLAKDLPTAEMEVLMLANMKLSSDAARDLALERSVVVKDYLIAQQIPKERLFLGGVKTEATPEGWIPSAEISLSMP